MLEMNVWQSFAMVSVGPFVIVFTFWLSLEQTKRVLSIPFRFKKMGYGDKILAFFDLILLPFCFFSFVTTHAFFIAHVVKAAQILTAYMMG